MTIEIQMKLAETPRGRICLHLVGLSKDHLIKWHIKGIMRELRRNYVN